MHIRTQENEETNNQLVRLQDICATLHQALKDTRQEALKDRDNLITKHEQELNRVDEKVRRLLMIKDDQIKSVHQQYMTVLQQKEQLEQLIDQLNRHI